MILERRRLTFLTSGPSLARDVSNGRTRPAKYSWLAYVRFPPKEDTAA